MGFASVRRVLTHVVDFFARRDRAEPIENERGPVIRGNIDRFNGEECAGWVLDASDLARPLTVQIIVDGAVVHTEVANLERRDLVPVFGVADHGFAFGISRYLKTGANNVELVLAEGGFAFSDARRLLDTSELAALVEEGEDGFLFLCNDSNRTTDVIEGRGPLTPEMVRALSNSLIRRFHMIRESGARCMTLVLPDKAVICNSRRMPPLQVSDARPAIQLREALAGRPVEVYDYATAFFDRFPEPADAFLKTDTHLSSAARHDLFRYIMDRLGLAPATGHEVSPPTHHIGDLGGKLLPPRTEMAALHRPLFETRAAIDEATPASASIMRAPPTMRSLAR
jgi:hypothetical protein